MRSRFDTVKSNVCHTLKRLGDIEFMIQVLENQQIDKEFSKQNYIESLYLLAMVDYLSRLHDIELCTNYNKLRHCKLDRKVYPSSIEILEMTQKFSSSQQRIRYRAEAEKLAIPEFLRHNIIEVDVRNVM